MIHNADCLDVMSTMRDGEVDCALQTLLTVLVSIHIVKIGFGVPVQSIRSGILISRRPNTSRRLCE